MPVIANPPYPSYFDVDGAPLEDGYIYFGAANQNPETNPITVYWDAAYTQPALQPIRTSGGFTYRAGTPANIYVSTDFSITVRDKNRRLVYTKLLSEGQATAEVNLQYSTQSITATAGQTVFGLSTAYTPGNNSLAVYHNGSRLIVGSDYTETSATVITLAIGATAGDVLQFVTATPINPSSLGASAVAYIPAGAGAVATNVQAKLRETVSVRDFGAVGDGVTDDTAAFALAAAYITAQGGGRLIVPAGIYIVGKQTFAGANGLGYAYQAADIIKITNCTRPVVVEFQGSVLRHPNGLRFGSFDPVTGAPFTPTLPFTNSNYAADPGTMLNFQGNTGGVSVVGSCELDGNNINMIIGGQWGDVGYQRLSYGIREYNNASFYAENVYTHHFGTDGIVCGYSGAVDGGPSTPKTLINVVSTYNGRQGLSWVGGIGFTAINCKFNHTGKAINAGTGVALSSSPGAGVDIEAESAVNRNGVFINCVAGNNAGYAMVADSGDSANVSFYDCNFYGTTQSAIWPKKPKFAFYRCTIAGGAVNAYVATNEIDRTKFADCLFSADLTFEGVAAAASTFLADFTSQNPWFDRCSFVTNKTTVRLLATTAATYVNCTFVQNGSTATAVSRGTFMGKNSFTVSTGTVDFTGSVMYGDVTYNGAILLAGSNAAQSDTFGIINVSGTNNIAWVANKILTRYAAPTTGTWSRGDRVFNNLPAVGSPKSWVCTVSGTPGTWVSEGNL